MAEWYYNLNGARQGPVTIETLKGMMADGAVRHETLVWCSNFGSTWKKAGDVEGLVDPTIPPPLPMASFNNTWIWLLATVPALGYFIQEMVTPSFGEISAGWITLAYFVVNVCLIVLDEKEISSSGRASLAPSAFFGALLVPFYIYGRNKKLGVKQWPFMAWVASFLLAAFAANGWSLPYLGVSTPTCNSPISISKVKEIFPQIPLNYSKLGASSVAEVKHVKKIGNVETCQAVVTTSNGTQVPVTYTIEERSNGYYYWYLQLGG